MSAADPFPKDRFTATLRHVPAYARLAWALAREPVLSKMRRAAVVGAAGYLASPIDLVPGVIPVLGQLDDLAVAFAAIKLALAGLSPEKRRMHLQAVGLTDTDLADDVRTVGASVAWVARAGGRTAGRAAHAGGKAALKGTKVVGSAAVTAGGAAARIAGSMARSVGSTAKTRITVIRTRKDAPDAD
jgi:uncharacterized membrane protein YkvA (DUF1232 family)